MSLLRRKKRAKTIVWGIRVPDEVRKRWQLLSLFMGIPVNRLIQFVLQDWSKIRANVLLDDEGRNQLAHKINQEYRRGRLA